MNYFRQSKFFLNILRHKLFGYRFPAHVSIAITNRCNLKCPYCFYGYTLYKEDKVSTEQLLSLIDELYNRGTGYINLSGGEPLLRKDIKKIIDHITIDKGMRCSISTNATLLEEKMQDVKNVGVITVSLDGNEEQHKKNRGDLNYQRALRGIEAAVRNNIKVATCTVLTKDNKDCVDDMVKLAKEKGIFSIFHFLYERLNPADTEPNALTREEETEIMDKIIAYKKAGYPVHYTAQVHKYIRDWPIKNSRLLKKGDKIDDKNFKVIPCVAGDLFCWIDANGSVWPCAILSGQVKALSFTEVGFSKAWDFVPKNRCESCSFFHQTEMNLLFSLQLRGWLDLAVSKFIQL